MTVSSHILDEFGLVDADLRLVHEGIHADLYRAGDLALKVFRTPMQRAANEFKVAKFLDGRFGSPRAHHFHKGLLAAISFDWIEGIPFSELAHRPELLEMLGERVATMHALDVPASSDIKGTSDPFSLPDRLLQIARGLAGSDGISKRGLAYIEANLDVVGEVRGLVHRDIKPENVLLTGDNREPVLLDWEFAGRFPPAWDFAKANSSLLFTPRAIAAFNAGYAARRELPSVEEVEFFRVFECFTAWAATAKTGVADFTLQFALVDLLNEVETQ